MSYVAISNNTHINYLVEIAELIHDIERVKIEMAKPENSHLRDFHTAFIDSLICSLDHCCNMHLFFS